MGAAPALDGPHRAGKRGWIWSGGLTAVALAALLLVAEQTGVPADRIFVYAGGVLLQAPVGRAAGAGRHGVEGGARHD
jgi:hypothetical protein